ncbi:hypothetical protein DUNSADRAFT_14430 [Dunaliella salina]|uniref:GPN-loop GTPase n=1 Tax=Dunaliella salina TaxID=3046 RepID=A0ABQ7H9J3_DUNSA|nr:hypothetical protein DUNSADRAFT_14430 [Dunaliella salina]|eukprot:KAF5843514.1 hypothetical protein DUNSADRAFT_14430 [Dunaliella salina]
MADSKAEQAGPSNQQKGQQDVPTPGQQGDGAAGGEAKPTVILVIGMAGSGKTTLIQRLHSHLHTQRRPPYIINMDPAVTHVPYNANIDIRDTVIYKQVMKQYNLGPNGGILTSCNLFATRFDQVMHLLEKKRDPPLQHVILDTPGQIEIFTWSASGQIVTELLASSFPTVVAYVVDTPRCVNPQTFMSNMLQACSILYKAKLPLLLVFNKCDVTRHEFALEWMADFEAYHAALDRDTTYAATLSRSLSLVLDEFYQNLQSVGVSAVTGEGMDDFFQAVAKGASEYEQFYVPEMEARRKEKVDLEARRRKREMDKLSKDMQATSISQGGASRAAASPGAAASAASTSRGSQGPAPQTQVMVQGEDDEGECDYELSDESVEESENDEDHEAK